MAAPRIVTLTLNPALDVATATETVRPTRKIRTTGDHIDPGGGGINVARVVHALGGNVMAVVLAGGPTGEMIGELLEEEGVPHLMLPIAGRTRITLNVVEHASGLEYRFVPEGPEVTEAELRHALDVLETVEGEWLVASGSLPRRVPVDVYAQIARIAARRGRKFVLDTSGAALRAAIGSGIDLLKPSLGELESLLGRKLLTPAQEEAQALALVRSGGARMVALTLGPDGAVLANGHGVLRMRPPLSEVHSAVGAGDSFLAAMVLSLANGDRPAEALAWAIAAGSAATTGIGTARLSRAGVDAMHRALMALPAEWHT